MGFYSFVVLGMAPFGSLEAGWVAEHLGVRTAIASGGVVCLVVAWAVGWKLGRKRRSDGQTDGRGWCALNLTVGPTDRPTVFPATARVIAAGWDAPKRLPT